MRSKSKIVVVVFFIIVAIIVLCSIKPVITEITDSFDNSFKLLSSIDNKEFESELLSYADKNDIDLDISYVDDLEAIEILDKENDYDGVWLSNSVWLFLLKNGNVTNSKSININPVVFGIKKSKAEELGFTKNEVFNKDIVNAIKSGKLKYVMSSVTKTNNGLIAYLGFLNALSNSPEILTSEMINEQALLNNLKALFSGVERVSGDNDYLENMFLNSSEYEAVLATESSLININKELEKQNKETLYLIYPKDGVSINDSPFAYIDNKQDKLDKFNLLQSFLLSEESQKKLEKLGKRTWYGGINSDADKNSFKLEWGIDTNKYLIPLKYPSKEVINEAILLYINYVRKPSSIAFCLDYSGSMYGEGNKQLEEAMSFILNYDTASTERIQFSEKDIIYVIPFSNKNLNVWKTSNGKDTDNLINKIKYTKTSGTTNIYGCAQQALSLVNSDSEEYTKTVILMTDGQSNAGSYYELSDYYSLLENKTPIYSIMFGDSDEDELERIAKLSNAKIFDGRSSLIAAFKEVRSYN